MSVTTKSALADELNITRGRVSHYIAAGMPVRSDGKLDRGAALAWIARCQRGVVGQDRGANRARRLARDLKPRTPAAKLPQRRDPEVEVAVHLVGSVGPLAARIAIQAGASVETAYAIDQLVAMALDKIACDALISKGFPSLAVISCLELAGRDFPEADWPVLAKQAGQGFDEEACQRHVDRVLDIARG